MLKGPADYGGIIKVVKSIKHIMPAIRSIYVKMQKIIKIYSNKTV